MSPHEDAARLGDMLASARDAIRAASDRSRTDLDDDFMQAAGVTRGVGGVGEAAGFVTADTRARIPDLPWADIVGMRHKLIHGYRTVDLDILWDVVRNDLPHLVALLESFLLDDACSRDVHGGRRLN